MRRARHRLQVSTFPFLAVLLCAMGALILVLLAMDRKGRVAARAKAAALAHAHRDDHARRIAERDAAHAAKKQAIADEWNARRRDLSAQLDAEAKAIADREAAVQARLVEAARKLREQEEIATRLRARRDDEKRKLEEQEQAAIAAREVAALGKKLATQADAARARLAAGLAGMEKLVADMKKARERDASTFSVVPYHGKRGTSRRPVYVECAGDGLVFHPGGKKLPAEDAEGVRAVAEARLAANGGPAYLMVLVRPDGIRAYYRLQAALKDVEVEFGYEMVDAGWKFEFPEEKEGPLSVADGKPVGPVRIIPMPARPNEGVAMAGPRGGMHAGRGSNEGRPGGGGTPGNGGPPPHPDAPLPGGIVTMARPQPLPKDDGIKAPSLLPGSPSSGAAGTKDQKGTSTEKAGKSDGPALPGSGQPGSKVKPPTQPRTPRPLRPAAVSSDDVIVHVECFADHAVIHPSRRRVAIEAMSHGDAHNPLWQQVRASLSRKPPGVEKPRLQIRFLVHPEGERTFHRAYPVLERLPATKTRQSLQPEDDAAAIIAGK